MTNKPMYSKVFNLLSGLAAVLVATVVATGTAVAATTLTVYTAIEAEELEPVRKAFRKEYPDIDINWVRDSTGIITAKVLAEKDNPRADIFYGTSATSLLVADSLGLLMPYAPKGLDKLDPRFRDPRNPPHWVGFDAYAAVICYNTVEAKKFNLPKPTSWKDLTKPVYKGYLVMPNPNSSGTGFLTVSAWLQMMGEEKAWKYMDNLHKNMAVYTHSGSKPCRQAAAGEHPIGISFAFRGARLKQKGAPLDLITPKEGIGWEVEASGIMKASKKKEAAKKFMDWSISPAAMKVWNQYLPLLARPDLAKPVKYFPEDTQKMMIDNKFAWAADNRKKILAKWQGRYNVKSEPKKK
ncbi:MAG: putative 2-aminoethylphosphonate ABC transporter substrate-binding protein [Gammaproteobacteria bacterium]|nr:putative 2-aminoethylphosphonate ABC transporter substrate-binding protein [Gammaproteobacteria bacterium]